MKSFMLDWGYRSKRSTAKHLQELGKATGKGDWDSYRGGVAGNRRLIDMVKQVKKVMSRVPNNFGNQLGQVPEEVGKAPGQ